ncbi:MAG: hypothetical protein RLZZ501_1769 [Pseudomonadota bacterium]
MNLPALFIRRPVATTLLTLGVVLAGLFAFFHLPVAPLPKVDFPTIRVQAQMAGASPETMAATVASPLERALGRIAGLTEITSESSTGSTSVTLQFDLDRAVTGAARDVLAAIEAAHADLPTALRANPTYHNFNPADAPVLIVALSSRQRGQGPLYDIADSVIAQRLAQVEGVGNVQIVGSSLPAVRVELSAPALFRYGIALEDVRAALSGANANSPKGVVEQGPLRWQLYANDQVHHAEDYRGLVIALRDGRPVRLDDVAEIVDSVEDIRNQGYVDGTPSVSMLVFKQAGANIIETVDRAKALLPQFAAALPADVTMTVAGDRSTTIRASLADTERTLLLSVILVVLVVWAFLRSARATLIPTIALPVSIVGTFAAMYLLGYSLDNLSLMALTVATGFIVDDAIVVLENVTRLMEQGKSRREAAIEGVREVAFTVVSMSLSLVAVFLPILLMGGLAGRLFQEFAAVLSLAILISLAVSLTATAALCAHVLPEDHGTRPTNRVARALEAAFTATQAGYVRSLDWVMNHQGKVLAILLVTIALNVALFVVVPKGLFPQQDNGLLMGGIQADQDISFQAMKDKLRQAQAIIATDPAVAAVVGFTGGRGTNSANLFITLKPRDERDGAVAVMNRLRPKLASIPGAQAMMFPMQDLFVGGRSTFGQFQYTLKGEDPTELQQWATKLVAELKHNPIIADVYADQQEGGLTARVEIDRQSAARFGLTPGVIDQTLYDAFGQRQVSTLFKDRNQYHVVMEIDPKDLEHPDSLRLIHLSTSGVTASGAAATGFAGTTTSGSSSSSKAYANQSSNSIAIGTRQTSSGSAISTTAETMIPLAAIARFSQGRAPAQVRHQDGFPATTLSFNLTEGASLADALGAIQTAEAAIGLPATLHGGFAGTAAAAQGVLKQEILLILAALAVVYVVLGILYESWIHPLTILSTLPPAGIGAILALLACGAEFTIIAMIGVLLLIGIVKKNAIMMIDFALTAERRDGLDPVTAIRAACRLRLRPILMTTFAALLGAVPLVIDTGTGAELRRPLGIAIIGGLLVSQVLTLYTTPVVYLLLDRLRRRPQPAAALPGPV